MSRSSLAFALSVLSTLALVAAPAAFADDSAPAASKSVDLENGTCPVKGRPVAEGVTTDVNGAIVHFCCTGCVATYRADPAKYEAALRQDPAVARRMDEAVKAHTGGPSAAPPNPAPVPAATKSDLHDDMRRLWTDHVVWTRAFIVSTAGDLPDKEKATQRLMKNQEDIGRAIEPFYGSEASSKLTALLKEHISIAADLVSASKANDAEKADAAAKKWGANADEIAAFLHGANPSAWPLEAAKSMLHEHLDLTTAEAKARLAGDWDADVAAFEKAHEQALHMADMLSDGIRRQFPQKMN